MAINDYKSIAQKFYVAYFGRPADATGLLNMATALSSAGAPITTLAFVDSYRYNSTVRAIIDNFGNSAESASLYKGDNVAFVTAIYENILKREPDTEGLKFWVGAIETGVLVRGKVALNIMGAAEANTTPQGKVDAALIANRIAAATYFTDSVNTLEEIAGYAGDAAAASARKMLSFVTQHTDLAVYKTTIDSVLNSMVVQTPTNLDLASEDDTGLSATDNFTQVNSGLTITGSAQTGTVISLYETSTGGVLGTGTAVNGQFSIDLTLTDGKYSIAAKALNAYGSNSLASAPIDVKIVTSLAAPQVKLTTDSGIVGDGITSQSALSISGVTSDTQVEYTTDSGNSWTTRFIPINGQNTVQVRLSDLAGNVSSTSAVLKFTLDTTAPELKASTPAADTSQVSLGSNISLTFNEAVKAGSGNFVISNGTTDTRIISVNDSSQVTFIGNTVTIDPTVDLRGESQYSVKFNVGAITDIAGNSYTDISPDGVVRFVTLDYTAPQLVRAYPAAATDAGIGSTIVLTFDEAVKEGIGNVTLSNDLGDIRTISMADSSQVVVSGNMVFIKPASNLQGGSTYSIRLSQSSVQDLSGNSAAALPGSPPLQFTTSAVASSNSIDLGSLGPSTGFRIDGARAGEVRMVPGMGELTFSGDNAGSIVSGGGDLNGDGYDDLLVSAMNTLYGSTTYVIFGSAAGYPSGPLNVTQLNGINGFKVMSGVQEDYMGWPVNSAGDVNGDGIGDSAIGASYSDHGSNMNAGAGYVVYGKKGGMPSSITLSNLLPTDGYKINGTTAWANAGSSISGAGDFNGDGIDDIIIGESGPGPSLWNSSFAPSPGASYIIPGRTTGYYGNIDLMAGMTGAYVYRIQGVTGFDSTGGHVSSAGDVNGDGFDDVILSATGADYAGEYSGSSYVVFGRSGSYFSSMTLASLNGLNGFRIDAEDADDNFGQVVKSAGDINGDGLSDIVIGAQYAEPNGAASGAAYVIFGKASGFSPVMSASSLDGANGFRLVGSAEADFIGYSADSAGDVNGDGFDDLIIGAYGADHNGPSSGTSYILFGKAGGFSSTLELSKVTVAEGIRLDGSGARQEARTSVSSAGDVNGDGFGDVIVGAPGANTSGGAAYVVYGKDFSGAVQFAGSSDTDFLIGSSRAENFVAGNGNDKVVSGGGADVLYGGAGDDLLVISDLAFRRIDGGSGVDKLVLEAAGQSMDLANFRGRIEGIEAIDIGGSGENSLSVSLRDIAHLSNSSNTLHVDGNQDDVVHIGSGWTDLGSADGYHSYSQGNVILIVGNAIQVLP